ncbi:twin arginine translocase protein A [Acetobacter sp. CAG:977]|nr:twin arginine translocase protein A [Acetobacter sp. CAG:977]
MGIGFWQLIVILLIVLVLFGRGKLPALAEDIGKSVRLFKKGLAEDENVEKKADIKVIENKAEENKEKDV